jgi:hypothetical protein
VKGVPTVAELQARLRSGQGIEDALNRLLSLPREERAGLVEDVEKLRAHDDWHIRRKAGVLLEGSNPAPRAVPPYPNPDWSFFVSERPMLAHPSAQPDRAQAWLCGACGSKETGLIFSVNDSGNSWRIELYEFRCLKCGKCTSYELESG